MAILRLAKSGGLIICAKKTDLAMWQAWFAACGRSEDLIVFGPGHDKKLNVLEDFSQQPPSDTAVVCNLTKNPNDNQQYVIKAD